MIVKNIDMVSHEDIQTLITNQVAESRTLEYKEQLPSNSDNEKKEFLADISAFANASGGDVIYGISEHRDNDKKTTGLPEKIKGLQVNLDSEIRRLESMIQDGIDPRIPGIRIVCVSGCDIIVIRIPKSWNSPHMVTFKNSSRFFARNSAGKYQLDVSEIRSSFFASESLAERIRQFRSDRIAQILSSQTPIPLDQSSRLVLHILPLESLNPGSSIDMNLITRDINLSPINSSGLMDSMNSSGWSSRYNFDGFCNYYASQSYVQAFRNGSLEAADISLLNYSHQSLHNIILIREYESVLVKSVSDYFSLYRVLEINPPIVIMLSLLEVKNYQLYWTPTKKPIGKCIDRDHLLIPEIIVEDYDFKAEDILRPAFDTVWQSCGIQQSSNYDKQGNWITR